jgi:hypothetical protein
LKRAAGGVLNDLGHGDLISPKSRRQRPGEDFFELEIAVDASPDVADDAAQIGLELAQASVGALELMGMGIALINASLPTRA